MTKGAVLLQLPGGDEDQSNELVIKYESQGGPRSQYAPRRLPTRPTRRSKVLGMGRETLNTKSFRNLHDEDKSQHSALRSQHHEMGSFYINGQSCVFRWWAGWMYIWLLFTAVITPFQFGFLPSIRHSEFADAGNGRRVSAWARGCVHRPTGRVRPTACPTA